MIRTDVAVVGAGAAGIAAALAAAADGASVTIVDAAAVAGGTARTAGGGTCIAGSARQAELGIVDDVVSALEDWVAWGGPSVDVAWAERYLDAAVGDLGRFLAELGVRWGDVRPQEGNRVPRWHEPVGGGAAIMNALERRARANPLIAWRLGTRVEQLVVTGGRVTGLAGHGPEGSLELAATSVLMATGGFANDQALVRAHVSGLAPADTVLLGGGIGARGHGHRMLATVGADLVHLDAVWMYPYATPDPRSTVRARGLALRNLDGDIWVNAAGERFHDESRRGGATGTPALRAQRGSTAWAILDAPIAARLTVADPGYRDGAIPDRAAIDRLLEVSPYIHQADDLRTLGGRAGIDAVALERTVREHNALRAGGAVTDPDFGRPLQGLPEIGTPPYYAIQLFPLARKNLGGARTDEDGGVVRPDGSTIAGLFAAGEVAGMAGGHVNGRAALEGTMLGPSLFSGIVAGAAMAA